MFSEVQFKRELKGKTEKLYLLWYKKGSHMNTTQTVKKHDDQLQSVMLLGSNHIQFNITVRAVEGIYLVQLHRPSGSGGIVAEVCDHFMSN